jgi:hypothetical protein
MRPKVDPIADAPGQDSFSDVVTNLVAVLIIMVTVVGVRAKGALLDAASAPAPAESKKEPGPDVAAAQSATDAVQTDIKQLASTMQRQQIEIAYRREERNRVQLLVAAAEDTIAKRRGKLDTSQQTQFDAEKDLIAAKTELQEIERSSNALAGTQTQTSVIDHLPTPMAKTVFGREIHFRLKNNRVVYVPWDELVQQLKDEVPSKIWRLKDEDEFTETLGPIGGFWMQYTLKRSEVSIPTKAGTAVQNRIELDQFTLQPVTEEFGESVDTALAPNSQFRTVLEQHRPAETTVTFWVYPDSFGHFRTFKQELYRLGYLTASRPLPEGHPIGGSPHGTRSASE